MKMPYTYKVKIPKPSANRLSPKRMAAFASDGWGSPTPVLMVFDDNEPSPSLTLPEELEKDSDGGYTVTIKTNRLFEKGDDCMDCLRDRPGSMNSPITGVRVGSTSKVTCMDVAGLFASVILRKNRNAEIIPFDTQVHEIKINGRDSILTNAEKLNIHGGGTNCSSALHHLNCKNAMGDVVIYVSDNESWADPYCTRGTAMLSEWQVFKKRNRHAKLICIDLTPRDNAQVNESKEILQVGGFGDNVFTTIANFLGQNTDVNHWVAEIEKVKLDLEPAKVTTVGTPEDEESGD